MHVRTESRCWQDPWPVYLFTIIYINHTNKAGVDPMFCESIALRSVAPGACVEPLSAATAPFITLIALYTLFYLMKSCGVASLVVLVSIAINGIASSIYHCSAWKSFGSLDGLTMIVPVCLGLFELIRLSAMLRRGRRGRYDIQLSVVILTCLLYALSALMYDEVLAYHPLLGATFAAMWIPILYIRDIAILWNAVLLTCIGLTWGVVEAVCNESNAVVLVWFHAVVWHIGAATCMTRIIVHIDRIERGIMELDMVELELGGGG